MNSQKSSENSFQDFKVNVKVKLAALWASFMFLYTYVDYFHLYMPGTLQNILVGKVFVFDITQTFLLITTILVAIPVVMIFLSIVLPAKVNRITNLIVATVFIPYMLFNLVGEAWIHMVLGAIIEVILLGVIIRSAWKWPRIEP
jgi:hypothetical protein